MEWHILKGNKANYVPNRLCFVDTETISHQTSKDLYKQKLVLGWACYIRVRKDTKNDLEDWFKFTHESQFWRWIENKTASKTVTYIFAHNFEFDYRVLKGFKRAKDKGWEIEHWIIDNDLFIVTLNKDGARIKLISTTNYFRMRLKKIGKSIGLKKLIMPKGIKNDKLTSEYCYRDVEIIRKLMLDYIELLKRERLGCFRPTIASQALSAYRHRFMTHEIFIHDNLDCRRLEIDSYKGGRTECFYVGEIKNRKRYKLDVNSMYASIMQKNEFPVKLVEYVEIASLDDLFLNMDLYGVIAEVRIKIDKNAIGYRDERLMFPIGDFWTVLTSPELEWVLNNGWILEVKRMAYYHTEPIFEKWVTEMYKIRMKYKKAGNHAFEFLIKTYMNSLYGKFAETLKENIEIGNTTDENNSYRMVSEDGKKRCLIRILNNKIYEVAKSLEGREHTLVSISSFVTAYARLDMWDYIEIAGIENVEYMDTDSLFVNYKGLCKLKKHIDDTKIGMLKLEDTTNYMDIRTEKDYTWGKKNVIKGIKKKAKQIAPNVFEQIQFEKFATALRKQRLDDYYIKTITKTLKRERKKNILLPNGRTTPYQLTV